MPLVAAVISLHKHFATVFFNLPKNLKLTFVVMALGFVFGAMNIRSYGSQLQLCSHTRCPPNAEADRRAIWPCFNVATWRRERSDRTIQETC